MIKGHITVKVGPMVVIDEHIWSLVVSQSVEHYGKLAEGLISVFIDGQEIKKPKDIDNE